MYSLFRIYFTFYTLTYDINQEMYTRLQNL